MDGKIQMFALSDTGRMREYNEDCVRISPASGLAVLADGLGGHAAGEIASRIAVDSVCDFFAQRPLPSGKITPDSNMQQLLRQAIRHANTNILRTASERPDCTGMGTTVVTTLFVDARMAVAHVGDSRAYRLRRGMLAPLTRDHSLVQEYVEAGIISADEARHSPQRHIVTQALGLDDDVTPDVSLHSTRPGDIYLLCSDGLSDAVTDAAICQSLVANDTDLKKTAEMLIHLANDAGGPDNISVILIRIP